MATVEKIIFIEIKLKMMEHNSNDLLNDLKNALHEAEGKVGTEIVTPKPKKIMKFCQLVGDTNPLYYSDNLESFSQDQKHIIPPGYLMNLTNQVIQKIFLEIGPLFISNIKGLIHVKSEVEFLHPIYIGHPYKIVIKTHNPIEKKGERGKYYSIIFETRVIEPETMDICAIDYHDFFFKLE